MLICGLIFGVGDELMDWKSFLKKNLAFSITLSFGLLIVEYYITLDKQESKIERANHQINQTIITSESKTNNSGHNKCIEFRGDNLYRKKPIRDVEEIENLLKNNDVVSRKKAKIYLKKLKRNQDKYRRIKDIEVILSAQEKSNGIHKLLYIENCVKYSE